MRGQCAVVGCSNKGVHIFPQNEQTRALWINALRLHQQRKIGWHLTKYSSICSAHFKKEDFIMPVSSKPGVEKRKRLKNGAVPSVFPWTPIPTEDPTFNPEGATHTYSRDVLPISFVEESPTLELPEDTGSDPLQIPEVSHEEPVFDPAQVSSTYSKDVLPTTFVEEIPVIEIPELEISVDPLEVSVQPENVTKEVSTQKDDIKPSKADKYVQVENIISQAAFSIHTYENDDNAIHFYTGLETYDKVLLVFATLGEAVFKLKYFYGPPPKSLSPLDQFFLTLIILRRHKAFEEISMLYLIPIKQVYNIFITWIRFIALQWRNIDLWIDKEKVHAYAPFDFYDKYPQTRVVLDATECPIKKPKLPLAQQITFSSYKNKNTVKVIVGIAPSGLITYVSPCYGGSATDRQIIERSTILKRFDYKDEIMVDKGLNVQDIFISYGVKVNMPSFFKKGNQINPDTLTSNRKVASKRVHVERVIGMLKTYKILTQPMNQTETLLASDIIFICAMFVNFRASIIKQNA